jgi:hypothetical protein
VTPQFVLRTYLHAKDENRPHLLTGVFATEARLETRDRSGMISFPAVTVGREAIADVLVRNFNQSYENIYTFCLDRPAADATSFSCDWLVGMTEKQTRNVRVGCGRYDWTFQADPVALATRLVITIESMVVLTPDASQPVLRWLVGMSYPWSSTAEVAAAPPLDGVEPVFGYLCRRTA